MELKCLKSKLSGKNFKQDLDDNNHFSKKKCKLKNMKWMTNEMTKKLFWTYLAINLASGIGGKCYEYT